MDIVKPESFDWALTHIRRFGDTDIFPVPFEFDAIHQNWPGIRDELTKIDLATYEGRALLRFLIPKSSGGYRVAIQLDPLDSLIYTAVAYEAAELIEAYRAPLDQMIACSYRVQIDASGQFFRPKNGWDDFHTKSQEYAESGRYEYVVTADIADFYNQISHHRVRNALESAGVSPERAKNLENYLMNLTRGQSRGIPVGPSGSILLAEACLGDVDTFLLRKGYAHTRYVDDFRIFCLTRTQAHQALHDLSEYLYTSHRLALQSNKTRPIHVSEFLNKELLDPEKLEERSKTEKIDQALLALSQTWDVLWYGSTADDLELSEEDLQQIARDTLSELFEACLAQNPLHQGLTRYLLRKATRLRTNVVQGKVLDNLEKLAPVMRDVSQYLLMTFQSKTAPIIGDALIKFLETSDYAFMPFLRLWITHVLTERLAFEYESKLRDFCETARAQLGLRPFALLARKLQYMDWIRSQKEIWQNNSPWDKRAVIWSSAALPEDERRFWLKRVENAGDVIDKAIAIAARNGL